jgi:hypothetical protein
MLLLPSLFVGCLAAHSPRCADITSDKADVELPQWRRGESWRWNFTGWEENGTRLVVWGESTRTILTACSVPPGHGQAHDATQVRHWYASESERPLESTTNFTRQELGIFDGPRVRFPLVPGSRWTDAQEYAQGTTAWEWNVTHEVARMVRGQDHKVLVVTGRGHDGTDGTTFEAEAWYAPDVGSWVFSEFRVGGVTFRYEFLSGD